MADGIYLEILEYQSTETAEAGTTSEKIIITDHGLAIGDFIVNETRRTVDAERGARVVIEGGFDADTMYIDPPIGEVAHSLFIPSGSDSLITDDGDTFKISDASGGNTQQSGDSIRLYKFTNRTSLVQIKSFHMTRKTQGLSTAKFTLVTDSSYIPQVGQYIRISWLVNSVKTRIFLGTLRSIKRIAATESETDDTLFLDCKCISLNHVPARRTIKIYEIANGTKTYGDIVQDMVDDYLFQDGITAGTINDGVVLPDDWVQDVISISEVLDECASKSGFIWFVDDLAKLHFYSQPTSVPSADYDITDVSSFKDYKELSFEQDIENHVNKFFIAGGRDTVYDNDIIIGSEDFDLSTSMQEVTGGTGVYGSVHRDPGLVETEYLDAEAGTTTTNITITDHGQLEGYMIWNSTRNEYRQISAIVDDDNFTVPAITGQTTGDDIAIFNQANSIIQNDLSLRGVIPMKFSFVTRYRFFSPGEKINVALAKYGISSSYYVIDDIEIIDGGGTLESLFHKVNCSLRDNANFNVQRLPNFKTWFGGF